MAFSCSLIRSAPFGFHGQVTIHSFVFSTCGRHCCSRFDGDQLFLVASLFDLTCWCSFISSVVQSRVVSRCRKIDGPSWTHLAGDALIGEPHCRRAENGGPYARLAAPAMVNSSDFAPLVLWLRGTSVSSVMVVLCFGITSWRLDTLRSVAAILCWLSHELRLDPTYFCSLSHYCLTLTWSFAHSWLSGMPFRFSGMCWLLRCSVWRLFLVPSSVVVAQAAILRSTRVLPWLSPRVFLLGRL